MIILDNPTWKIARIYNKKNKKRFIRMMFSLSFSFIMLICISYISISFDLSYKRKMNSEDTILSCQFRTSNDEIQAEVNEMIKIDKNIKENLLCKFSYISYYLAKEYPSMSAPTVTYYPIIEIDGVDYNYSDECKSEKKSSDNICFIEEKSKILLETEIQYAKKKNINLIYGDNEIESNSVFINSSFCDYYNIDYSENIGKKLSYKCYTGKDNVVEVIDNYVIKGVINNALYDIPTRYLMNDIQPLFLLTSECQNTISSMVKSDDYNINILQFKNFLKFESGITKYLNFYTENVQYTYIEMVELAMYYIRFKPLVSISQIILFTLAIFIFVIGILNLFHAILFICESQFSFLNMCQAIGLKKSDRRLFNFYQNILIFAFPIIISSIISFVLSFLVSSKLNESITLFGEFTNVIMFDMKYYPIALVIFIFGIFILLSFISIITDKILHILNNKKTMV